ncbi:MAG TPA: ABC transporter permease [Candidatus Limiplasma stercoravium]|nr:ABC transporter permease [Candidatus Limiplasma stercoravium]
MLRESLRMSLSNILGNKLRSLLTTLGIVIGVMAIIALVTIMQSATSEVSAQFESLGAGKLTVQASGTPLKRGLNANDLAAVEALEGVDGISPTLSQEMYAAHGDAVVQDVLVKGYGFAYFRRESDAMARGRPLTPIDQDALSRVCLVDAKLAAELFAGEDPLGKSLTLNGVRFAVVGLLQEADSGDMLSQLNAGGESGTVILPYTTYQRVFGAGLVTSLEVYVRDPALTASVSDELEETLGRAFNYRDDSYTVINMESLLDVMDTMMGLMTNLLVGIASIALLVGGIGIMNMMLVSVTERTGEIGLRKALGARPRSIQFQFLMESVILSLLGGLLGTALGLALSLGLSRLMDIPFTFSPGAVALGAGFSLAVGVVFGWAPARKASHLNPIDALRSV